VSPKKNPANATQKAIMTAGVTLPASAANEPDRNSTANMATIAADDQGSFRVLSNHVTAATCLVAQEDAYSYARRLYPRSAETMKKPPYLIWPGPGPTGNADV